MPRSATAAEENATAVGYQIVAAPPRVLTGTAEHGVGNVFPATSAAADVAATAAARVMVVAPAPAVG